MSASSPASSWRSRFAVRLRGRSPLGAIPSWLVSLLLHAAVLFFFASQMLTPALKDVHKGEDGGLREVGIVVKPSQGASERIEAPDAQPAAAPQAVAAQAAAAQQPPSLSESAVVPLALPARDPLPVFGMGAVAPPPGAGRDVVEFVKPSRTPAGGGAVGRGVVPGIFGKDDSGTQVIYIIDCSDSMRGAPLFEAKVRLMQCVQQLDATQRFQIIFYNDRPFGMSIRGTVDQGLYFATDIIKTQARQFIESRVAAGGTEHMPALEMALRLRPEVIYLLTDAQTGLNARQLNHIRTLNRGTRIHCIEFGEGPGGLRENFLKHLARLYDGSYTYQDVTRFRAE